MDANMHVNDREKISVDVDGLKTGAHVVSLIHTNSNHPFRILGSVSLFFRSREDVVALGQAIIDAAGE